MNLLILDQFSDPGGAQRCLLDLLPALRDAGWKASVGLPGNGEVFERVRDAGFRAVRIRCGPYASGRKSAADAVRFLADTPALARQIGRLIDETKADLLYVNGPRLLPAAALARPAVPVVFHSHSALRSRRLPGMSLRRLGAWVVGACRFVAEPWREFVPEERIAVVYNGVAGPVRGVWQSRGDAPLVGCIGRISPEKGQLEFVAAARQIYREIPGCRFVIQGAVLFGDPAAREYESRVRSTAEGLPLDFAGWTSDVAGVLAGLDLLLVPSAAGQEATTRVILEAYAAGVPVIAFPSGGIPEVVTPDCLAGSVEEMGKVAVGFLRHPDPARSQSARETWCERFTIGRYQREMVELLERVSSHRFAISS